MYSKIVLGVEVYIRRLERKMTYIKELVMPQFSDQKSKIVPHLSQCNSTCIAFLTIFLSTIEIDEVQLLERDCDLKNVVKCMRQRVFSVPHINSTSPTVSFAGPLDEARMKGRMFVIDLRLSSLNHTVSLRKRSSKRRYRCRTSVRET